METTELVRATLEAGGVVPPCIVLVSNWYDEIILFSAIDTRIKYLLHLVSMVVVIVCAAASVTLIACYFCKGGRSRPFLCC